MKKIILMLCGFLFSMQLAATDVPLDTIRQMLIDFWEEEESYHKTNYTLENSFQWAFIHEVRTRETIKEGMNGVFAPAPPSSISFSHLLFIDDDSYFVMNMEKPCEENLPVLMDFFKKNPQYTKEDIFIYVDYFLRVYKDNEYMRNMEFLR